MDSELMERLLHEDESAILDFKRTQYPFEKANDVQKSELLKDILAFANAWRRTDAYILVGVQEVQGGRSKILGVTDHLPEASLQQFVNSKTNRPIRFSYKAVSIDDDQIGIIRIPLQNRPFYLQKNFGKLEKHVVYIRRGSSTDIAEPDEIAQIGSQRDLPDGSPLLSLDFADTLARKSLGRSIAVYSTVHIAANADEIPDYRSNRRHQGIGFSTYRDNEEFYRDYAEYIFLTSALVPVGLAIQNLGSSLIRNAKLEMKFSKDVKISFWEEVDYPERPAQGYDLLQPNFPISSTNAFSAMHNIAPGTVSIAKRSDHWDISISLGDIQPKAFVWSDQFYVLCEEPGNPTIEFDVQTYMDDSEPLSIPLAISFLHDYEAIEGLEELQELIAEDERRQQAELDEFFGG